MKSWGSIYLPPWNCWTVLKTYQLLICGNLGIFISHIQVSGIFLAERESFDNLIPDHSLYKVDLTFCCSECNHESNARVYFYTQLPDNNNLTQPHAMPHRNKTQITNSYHTAEKAKHQEQYNHV
jgi:hypothetical protein